MINNMRVIDFHAHVYPEKISAKAVENVGHFYNLEMGGDGTISSLVDIGKSSGIDNFVIHSPALTPNNVKTINDFIAAGCKENPSLLGLGTLHSEMENPEEEINRIIELGLLGIKIHPDSQQFNIDDKKMLDIYEILQAKSLPILMHTGDYRYDYSHPRRLANVLDMFPNLTVIGAHLGGWSIFDLAIEYLLERDCYLDISSSLSFIGNKRAKEIVNLYGADRILFGSDFPMWSPKSELERFLSIGFSDNELELMLSKNAENILNLTDI